jgi:hypothetical protein
MADHEPATDNKAFMVRTSDGHRAYPRYPDGIDFELKQCDVEGDVEFTPSMHVSEIRDYREDFR